jgi:hypothetical protein
MRRRVLVVLAMATGVWFASSVVMAAVAQIDDSATVNRQAVRNPQNGEPQPPPNQPPTTTRPPDNPNAPYINRALIPGRASSGSSQLLVRPTDEIATPSDVGAFRISCGFSHMSFDDPIVFPNQPGMAHLHSFFGNTDVDAYSTAESIRTSGNSTCATGIGNRSGYWIPSMIDTRDGRPLVPTDSLWYYKRGYSVPGTAAITAPPVGLRIIAGKASNAGPPPQFSSWYRWHCASSTEHYNYGFTIPDCPVGDSVSVEIWFPQCWDGINLDSPDHQSHMAYASTDHGGNGCPTTHPHPMPEITFNVSWVVPPGSSSTTWRLSSDIYPSSLPGGYSVHADWYNGWDVAIRDAWVNGCVRAQRDCHAHLLGDGREIYR